MSYFQSLSDFQATKDAINQQTVQAEQNVLDKKAEASDKAFEGYSQLLEAAGGGTTGLAGGIHLTRKIYKKFKAGKKALSDAKNKITGEGDDNETGQENDGENDSSTRTDDTPENEPENDDRTQVEEDETNDPSSTDDPQAPSTDETTTDADPLPEPPEPEPTNPSTSAAQTTTDADPLPEDPLEPADVKVVEPEFQDAAKLIEPEPVSSITSSVDPKISAPKKPIGEDFEPGELGGGDEDEVGGRVVGQTATAPEPEPTTVVQPQQAPKPDPEVDEEDIGEPLQIEAEGSIRPPQAPEVSGTDATQQVSQGTDSALNEGISGEDRLAQGAKAFEGTRPTPQGTGDIVGDLAGGDTSGITSTVSEGLSTTLDAISTGLDFLGPVGEVVGAGIMLGGFFHSLFGGKSEKQKEASIEDAPVAQSLGGGISVKSLQDVGQQSTTVGTLV